MNIKKLIKWVDNKPEDRTFSINYGLTRPELQVHVSTFEFGNRDCSGLIIDSFDDISGQLATAYDGAERRKFLELSEKYGETP